MNDQSSKILEEFKKTLLSTSVLQDRATLLLDFAGNYGQTYPEYLKNCLEEVIEELPDESQIKTQCLLEIGWITFDESKISESLACFQKSVSHSEKNSDTFCLIRGLNGLASCLSFQKHTNQALDMYEKALTLAENTDEPEQQKILLTNISITLLELGHYEEALEYLQKNHKIGWNDEVNPIINLNQMSSALIHLGRFDEAQPYVSQVLAIATPTYLPRIYAEALADQGSIFLSNNDITQVEQVIQRLEDFQTTYKHPRISIRYELLKAGFALLTNQLDLAKKALDSAEQHNWESTSPLTDQDLLRLQIQLYEKQENYKKAFELLVELDRIKTEQNTLRIRQDIARITSRQAQREAEIYKELYQKITSIGQIGQLLTANLNLEDIIEVLAQKVQEVIPCDSFGLSIYNEKEQTLDYKLFIEQGERINPTTTIRPVGLDSLSGWTVINKKEILLSNAPEEYHMYIPTPPPRIGKNTKERSLSIIYIPLMMEERILGVASVQHYQAYRYTQQDVDALKALGAYIAIALANARLYDKVHKLASTDMLTGAMTRHRLYDVARNELARYKRFGIPYSVIILDLDHFKSINDSYGHTAGDYTLKEFARRCQELKRDLDHFARYGGEEFLFILPATDLGGAFQFAERLRKEIYEQGFELLDGEIISVTASFGVTQVRESDESLDDQFLRIDKALYTAKEKGRNQVVVG
jgi:diguanylate cyclase (GGDEF)-like protein